jgi:outer membrane protein assembly factor BamB
MNLKRHIQPLILLLLVILVNSCSTQQNWNQYLGPDRNAMLAGGSILRSWGDKGPEELWSFPLGEGYGGAAIFKDEVFILDRIKGESDILRCIDLESGEEKWNYAYEASGQLPYPGSRAVPTIDKKYVWSVGPHGHFICFDKKTGEPVWEHHLLEEFNGKLPNWGVSQSPLIYKDLVIVAPQGMKAGVVAFQKATGEIVWKSRPLTGHHFHVSPILADFGGVDQVIMISPYHRDDSTKIHEVVAFDAVTGMELWKYDGLRSFATITPATVIDETRLFLTDCSYNGRYGPVSIMLEIHKIGDEFIVRELFKTEEAGSKMHPAVLFEDHLYLNHTSALFQMMCLTLDGKVVWEEDVAPGFELGAMILVDGLILNQNGRNGDIHLIEPSPRGYKELGVASFFGPKRAQSWAPLAFSQGKLIIRDLEKMVCVDLQKLGD